ncbi:MAG: hypothetical protein FD165_1164 [Gammaproteobacteria bacterium]|nr:MAG: hypothetical protein FD165_1164 [Gammaproteobacteria bacterium]TND07323.1 MAG: hypothetical protein FD120_61 [Gammaproteobacteria bacterium]
MPPPLFGRKDDEVINRVFHQIWINKAQPELPEQFKRYRDTWLAHHPDWEYRLWNLENLDFRPECESLLSQCQQPAQMADLLRIEILFRHGGVYVDTDFECLRSIDDLLHGVSGFACSEDGRYLASGILGATQSAPWLRRIIDRFPEQLGIHPVNIETGPVFLTSTLLRYGTDAGFILFPTNYFYPFNYHTKNRSEVDLSKSYAVHHYADSWKTPPSLWRRILRRIRRR